MILLMKSFCHQATMFLFFLILPIFLLVAISWTVYSFTEGVIDDDSWVSPLLLLASTFLAGVVSRQLMNLHRIGGEGMMLLLLGMIAHICFAYLTFADLQTDEGVYSAFLPKPLGVGVYPYIFALPVVGMLGILFSKNFTLSQD